MDEPKKQPGAPWKAPRLRRIAAKLAEGNAQFTSDGPNNGKS